MKQYEAYTDSGIQWLGEIPSHWDITPLKFNLSLKGRIGWNGLKSDEFKEDSYAYLVTGQDFIGKDIDWSACYQIDRERYEEDPFIQLANGDLLVTKDGTIGKIARVRNLDKPACLNSGIFVVKQVTGIYNQDFLYWTLFSSQLSEFNSYMSTGSTIQHLYQNVFENMPLVVPPLAEQEVIAAYLDQKVGKIDAILSEKEAMVEQLQQYRKSLISETVTRGLDPNVPMKDSGIDWIGQIPQHWSMVKLKYISSLQSGSNLTSEQIKDTGEYPVFGGNGLRGYYHDFNTEGDRVLIGRQGALCGNINYASGKFWATEHAVVCHPIKQYNVIWLGSLLEIMNLNQYSIASAQPGLSVDRIKQLEIPLPPFEEQEKIGSLIEKKDSELKQTISELQSQIEDLKAYKSSVITEAVTGKVDLRDWKPSEVTA